MTGGGGLKLLASTGGQDSGPGSNKQSMGHVLAVNLRLLKATWRRNDYSAFDA